MTKFLIGAAAIAIAGAAFAQGMQPPMVQTQHMDMPEQSDQAGGRTQTRAEVIAKTQQHFAMMDANHDGFVTADEMQAMGGGHQMGKHMGHDGGEMAMNDGPMGNPGAMFDRLDTNHDGAISRDEFAKGREMRIERKVVINNGPGDASGEHGGMKMHGMGGGMGGMHGGGGMGAHMLKLADANSDGRISLQELTAASLQRFDRADANRDGQVTQEERKAMRQQMKLQRGRTL